MKTFKDHLIEGMPRGMIVAFDAPKGEVQIYRKGLKGFYGDAWNKFDFSAKDVKELRDKLKDMGVNPDKPSFGELPKK